MVSSEADAGLEQTAAVHASAARRNASISAKVVLIPSLFTKPCLTTLGSFPFPPILFGTAQHQRDILDEMGQPGATAPRVLLHCCYQSEILFL